MREQTCVPSRPTAVKKGQERTGTPKEMDRKLHVACVVICARLCPLSSVHTNLNYRAPYRVSSRREKLQRLEPGAALLLLLRGERLFGAGLDEVDDLGVRLRSHGFDSASAPAGDRRGEWGSRRTPAKACSACTYVFVFFFDLAGHRLLLCCVVTG